MMPSPTVLRGANWPVSRVAHDADRHGASGPQDERAVGPAAHLLLCGLKLLASSRRWSCSILAPLLLAPLLLTVPFAYERASELHSSWRAATNSCYRVVELLRGALRVVPRLRLLPPSPPARALACPIRAPSMSKSAHSTRQVVAALAYTAHARTQTSTGVHRPRRTRRQNRTSAHDDPTGASNRNCKMPHTTPHDTHGPPNTGC